MVFTTLTDLPNYGDWLCESGPFKGTTKISDTPIRKGSTYVEVEPKGTRVGEVLELVDAVDGDEGKRERKVVFYQPMQLKPEILGLALDILVTMVVRPQPRQDGDQGGSGSVLEREIRLGIPLVMIPLTGWVAGQFREESWRAMMALKKYLETKGEGQGAGPVVKSVL